MFEPRGAYTFDYALHEGSGTRMQFHFADEMRMPVAIQTWELEPGGHEGMHAHHRDDMTLEEFYLVLEGTASMRVGQEQHELKAGDSILAPAGVEHDLRNTGDGTLRVLVVWGEEGHKDFSAFGSLAAAREARARND
ncbi:cupin domain-containing protein [Paeniglutamicibacter sulfureus]|mgnify:CR=1 FL=1|uniref:Mannose-6-phosphate isomerase-like protein (Cupin superfamily) n=1 Tax=Paeniglutamicibacter sulfureus TaxID=43666 RepID=A0ABU2BGJ4_9MICC|nr:cupin domain-containing protein [Paeniglutamicibacter sulfureus]MDR7357759.1 mannose-6-phosphate isomerase-like protein (cupin superfamily) [Paeniglutamicibacter sulfureus]